MYNIKICLAVIFWSSFFFFFLFRLFQRHIPLMYADTQVPALYSVGETVLEVFEIHAYGNIRKAYIFIPLERMQKSPLCISRAPLFWQCSRWIFLCTVTTNQMHPKFLYFFEQVGKQAEAMPLISKVNNLDCRSWLWVRCLPLLCVSEWGETDTYTHMHTQTI